MKPATAFPALLAFGLTLQSAAAQTQFRARTVAADAVISDVEFVDLDGDGDQDLLLTRLADLSWMENDGAGNFTEHLLPAGLSGIPVVATGDFDGDGDADGLALSPALADSFLIRNTGGAPAVVSLGLPALSSPQYRQSTADFDGDGDLDVVVMPAQGSPFLLRNDGTARFAVDFGSFLGVVATFIGAAQAGDFDGDGDLDVFARGPLASMVLINDGSGVFTERLGALPAQTFLSSSAVGDFTGDGLDDIFAVRSVSGTSSVFAADGTGGFVLHSTVSSGGFYGAAAVDVDEDGDLDVVTTGNNTGLRAMSLLLNDGTGRLVDGSAARVEARPISVARLAVGDADGDGDADVFLGGFPLPVAFPQLLFVNHHRQVWVPAPPAPGQNLVVRCSYEPGYGAGLGLALPALGPAASTPVPTLFGVLHIDPTDVLALPFVSLPSPRGEGEVRLAVPNDPALSGTEVLVQALLFEPFGTGQPRLTGFARVVVR